MRRRFEKRVYIALPEPSARTVMFKLNLGNTPHGITDEQFQFLGDRSEGYSGSVSVFSVFSVSCVDMHFVVHCGGCVVNIYNTAIFMIYLYKFLKYIFLLIGFRISPWLCVRP
jgi:hypothetical protein